MDIDYCWIHLRKKHKVRIAPSSIKINGKSIGLGLYASNPNSGDDARAIVFQQGDIIGQYLGQRIQKQTKLNKRYDKFQGPRRLVEQTAPYAIVTTTGTIYDALCRRNFIAYANDARGTNMTNNATVENKTMKAISTIRNGDEILWPYGDSYWEKQIAQIQYKRQYEKSSKKSKSRKRR
jgi:hypothetical protein